MTAKKCHVNENVVYRVLGENNIEWRSDSLDTEYREKQIDIQLIQDIIAPKRIRQYQFHGDAILTADYHNPCCKLELVDAVISEATKLPRPRKLFIVGDYFNFDVLSHWSIIQGGDEEDNELSDEINLGTKILQKYERVFDEIYYSLGNHEERFLKAIKHSLSYKLMLDFLNIESLQLIEGYHFYLDNIRVTHPKSYSQIKLSVAGRLCDKYCCDVIQAHGHFATCGYSRGGFRAVDLPCMADWHRVLYMTRSDTTHPLWNNGFLVYKDGQILLKAKGFGL